MNRGDVQDTQIALIGDDAEEVNAAWIELYLSKQELTPALVAGGGRP